MYIHAYTHAHTHTYTCTYIYTYLIKYIFLFKARLILAVIFGPPLCIFAIMIYIRMGKLQFNIVGSNKVLMSKLYSFVNYAILLSFFYHIY